VSAFAGKSNTENVGFHDELTSIIGPAGVMQITEPALSELSLSILASGAIMDIR
jgi:hypothetical protein